MNGAALSAAIAVAWAVLFLGAVLVLAYRRRPGGEQRRAGRAASRLLDSRRRADGWRRRPAPCLAPKKSWRSRGAGLCAPCRTARRAPTSIPKLQSLNATAASLVAETRFNVGNAQSLSSITTPAPPRRRRYLQQVQIERLIGAQHLARSDAKSERITDVPAAPVMVTVTGFFMTNSRRKSQEW